MESYKQSLLLCLLLVSILSCSKNQDIQEKIKPFVGTYILSGTSINGPIEVFDSSGYPMGIAYDTIQFENDTTVISLQGQSDTLVVAGLRNDWEPTFPNGRVQAQGVLKDGSIQLIYDKSEGFTISTLQGDLHIDENLIEANYDWRSENTWSPSLPRLGEVSASGAKL